MLVTAAGRPYGEKIWLTSTDSTLILHAEASGVLKGFVLGNSLILVFNSIYQISPILLGTLLYCLLLSPPCTCQLAKFSQLCDPAKSIHTHTQRLDDWVSRTLANWCRSLPEYDHKDPLAWASAVFWIADSWQLVVKVVKTCTYYTTCAWLFFNILLYAVLRKNYVPRRHQTIAS